MRECEHGMTGAWALDALDGEERERVRRCLAADPEAAAEARSFEETAGELAASVAPIAPPPALRSAVMARIATTRQLSPLPQEGDAAAAAAGAGDGPGTVHAPSGPGAGSPAQVVPLDRYRRSVRRSRWTAAAAALLLVTTIAGAGLWSAERAAQQEARASLEAIASEQAAAAQEQELLSVIMAADDAAHLSVPSAEGGSLEVMYSRAQEALIVQAAGLPSLPADETYQLWMIDGSGPVSAGVLPDPEEPLLRSGAIPAGAVLGLTIEPAGGSEQPTMEPIAQEEL